MKYSKDRKYRDASTVVEETKVTKIKRKIKNKTPNILKNIVEFFKKNK
jgi:hypothetical protein